jgi:hypothetical protein
MTKFTCHRWFVISSLATLTLFVTKQSTKLLFGEHLGACLTAIE